MNAGAVLLNAVLWTPLAGAVVVGLLPRDDRRLLRMAGLGVGLVTFVLSVAMFSYFEPGASTYQLVTDVSWIADWGVRYHLGIDGLSLWMIMLTTFLLPLGMLASWPIEDRVKPYVVFLLAAQTGMIGVFSSLDLFLFYLFWETTLIPIYFLIGIWGHARRLYATMKFFLYTLAGSLLMLVAILYIYFAHEPRTFDLVRLLHTPFDLTTQILLFLAFFASFAVKVPLVPFHTWLPDAHTQAPTAGSVDLAAVLLKMGPYGFLRFAIPLLPDAARAFAPYIVGLSIAGIIWGAVVALMQTDLKRLVAYSSVSHLGFAMLGIFVGTIEGMNGGILQMLNHGLSTGALFLLVGFISDRRHTREIGEFGGLARSMPIFAGLFLFVALSSMGLPGLNNFVGEFLVLLGTFDAIQWWVVPAALGVVLGAIYLLWSYQRVFHGDLDNEANRRLPDLDLREIGMIVPVAALIVFIGLFPRPFLERIEPAARRHLTILQHWSVLPGADAVARTGPRP